jgi:hypothetical protein
VYILVCDMLQQLQLAVGSFGEYRRTEWLHDLLNRDRRTGQLVLCGTAGGLNASPLVLDE